ncbi:MAG: YaiI/YqxD family protein [Myxococcota bacterium]|nr:YaiI/YqxD family protein [Myxococcota bacterium]
MSQTIWVDADALPRALKEILIRCSQRRRPRIVMVANRVMATLPAPTIEMVTVKRSADSADDYIAEQVEAGDLVITADVPLASRVVAEGATVLQPRGTTLDADNVDTHLSVRNFHDTLRSIGIEGGGPPPLSTKHIQSFSNALDRWVTRRINH